MKKLYLTMLAIIITGSCANMLQATVYSIKVINDSGAKVYLATEYRKSGHKSDQGRKLELDAGATGNIEYEDSFKNLVANKDPIEVNKDGKPMTGMQSMIHAASSSDDGTVYCSSDKTMMYTVKKLKNQLKLKGSCIKKS